MDKNAADTIWGYGSFLGVHYGRRSTKGTFLFFFFSLRTNEGSEKRMNDVALHIQTNIIQKVPFVVTCPMNLSQSFDPRSRRLQ